MARKRRARCQAAPWQCWICLIATRFGSGLLSSSLLRCHLRVAFAMISFSFLARRNWLEFVMAHVWGLERKGVCLRKLY